MLVPVIVYWIVHSTNKTEDTGTSETKDDGRLNNAYRGYISARDANEENTWLVEITEMCSNASKYKMNLYKVYVLNLTQGVNFSPFEWKPFSYHMSITVPKNLTGVINENDAVIIFTNNDGVQIQFPTHGKGYDAFKQKDSKA